MVLPHPVYRVVLVVQVALDVLEILFHLSLPEDPGVQADLESGVSVLAMTFYPLQLKNVSACVWTSDLEKGEVKLFPVYIMTAGTDEETLHLFCTGLSKKGIRFSLYHNKRLQILWNLIHHSLQENSQLAAMAAEITLKLAKVSD